MGTLQHKYHQRLKQLIIAYFISQGIKVDFIRKIYSHRFTPVEEIYLDDQTVYLDLPSQDELYSIILDDTNHKIPESVTFHTLLDKITFRIEKYLLYTTLE